MHFRGPVHAGFIAALALVAITASCARHHARAVTPSAPAIAGRTETGVASWYGVPYHGRQTSSGEVYDMYSLTAAHRDLPFQTWVQVENLTNGKRVDVRINDRGPFVHDRIIDLSQTAAKQIDMLGPGTAHVRLTVIAPPANLPSPYPSPAASNTSATRAAPSARVAREPAAISPIAANAPATSPSPAPSLSSASLASPSSSSDSASPNAAIAPTQVIRPPLYAVQAAAFADRDRAELFREKMADAYADARTRLDSSRTPMLWRVVVGREMTKEQAGALAQRVRTEAGAGVVIPEPDADPHY